MPQHNFTIHIENSINQILRINPSILITSCIWVSCCEQEY
jgi:hypothetical protein